MAIAIEYSGWLVLAIFGFFTFWFSWFTVEQQTAKVVQRFGRFAAVKQSGLRFKIPWIDWVAGEITLRVQQIDVPVETKTKDNVFVITKISVQYFVPPENVYDAFYRLAAPDQQIKSYVFDTVRARVPTIILDDVFDKKDEIADAVKEELTETMSTFGYSILQALVTDIDPDATVKASMNEINAAQRLRIAAVEKGEADRILKVKAAEAEAQSKKLQGQGIADQRKAIIDGLRGSITEFKEAVEGANAKDVMTLVMMTQYFDTLQALGDSSETKTIFVPHGPGNLHNLNDQIRDAMMSANEAATP